jgi:sugar lactone lactonase YvrE
LKEPLHERLHCLHPEPWRARPAIVSTDLPERCANVCFGGLHRNRLFMAATTSLSALYVNTQSMGYA